MGLSGIAHTAAKVSAWVLNNPYTLGLMAWVLVFVPILGMWAVHKYGWEHWEPFNSNDKPHKGGSATDD
tara:strand:+ start:853 stop:1059 length:207 start_codon:yes stop_codon:yes gene_type:complete